MILPKSTKYFFYKKLKIFPKSTVNFFCALIGVFISVY